MVLLGQVIYLVLTISCCSASINSPDSCIRFGGGSCCRLLNALDRPINDEVTGSRRPAHQHKNGDLFVGHPLFQTQPVVHVLRLNHCHAHIRELGVFLIMNIKPSVVQTQPEYIVFIPENEVSCTIDNICITFFPLPDDSQTYLLYSSRVYNDGYNEITTFILSEPEVGVRRNGRGLFQFTDTNFAEVDCQTRPVVLTHRCEVGGECSYIDPISNSNSNVYGLSNVRRPISRACLSGAKAAISNNGLPEEDYYILPMRLPSRCVLNQVCTVAPALQRFCQTVGVAFPSVNRCANTVYGSF